MGQVLVRELDDAVIARLKAMAKRENISLEQKFRDMAIREANTAEERFQRVAQRLREQTRGTNFDTTAMIREDRDR